MIARPPRRFAVIALVLVVAGAAILYSTRRSAPPRHLDASGTVEATESQLGFPTTGRLDSLLVQEGDRVTKGQLLARLDAAETRARLEEAKARAAAARAGLDELVRGSRPEEVASAQAAADAAREKHRDALRDLERTTQLFDGGAVSREAVDKAEMNERVAASAAQQASEQLQLWETGPRVERVAQQRALVAQAEAQMRILDASLANLSIEAPMDAVVTVKHREPGEIVPAGSPVVTLMSPADRWVRIYVSEDRIGLVRLDTPAVLTTDSFPGKEFSGKVSFIASEAEFTPKNVQTTEERVKLVYAVKVRIIGDPNDDLKPGMPVDVVLNLPGA